MQFNLFNHPTDKETLDSWAKWLEDLAKVAIVAIPMIIFGDYSFLFKVVNSISLIFGAYSCMLTGKLIRKNKDYLSSHKEN